jgi:hypothetical protein
MHRCHAKRALPIILGLAGLPGCGQLVDQPLPLSQAPATELAAHAQMVSPFFNELDCENLGYVQPGEVDEHVGPIFLSFDTNRSRDIDATEWRTYPYMPDKPLMALSFRVADRDGDKVVSIREFTDYMRQAVSALDGDGDGEVSPAELEALLPPG